jgi:hypothetical protein
MNIIEILTELKNQLAQKLQQETWQPLVYAYEKNRWFTPKNLQFSLQEVIKSLDKNSLQNWLHQYPQLPTQNPKKIGIIMAGNLPLVGWADFMAGLMSGHHLFIKLSTQDEVLLPAITEILFEIEPNLASKINFVHRLKDCDAYIATGSNNSARYFQEYFGHKPHIIRQNRNSVAILNGNETKEDFEKLGEDIFMYFGLGCRNVCKLFAPKNYDFKYFFEGIFSYREVAQHNKYFNNYEYQRAVCLINQIPHFDNNFLLLRETEELTAPTGVIFYEFYDDIQKLNQKIESQIDKIQVIVSKNHFFTNSLNFGETQHPNLWDYADGVDTMEFLATL